MTSYLSPIFMATSVVCLTWIIVHCLIASRVKTFPALLALLFVILGVSFADDIMGKVYSSPAISIIVLRFMTPLLIPAACIYLQSMKPRIKRQPFYYFFSIIPVGLFTACLILTNMMGLDMTNSFLEKLLREGHNAQDLFASNTERVYYFVSVELYRMVLLAEVIFFYGYSAYQWVVQDLSFKRMWSFFKKGETAKLFEVQLFIAVLGASSIALKTVLQEIFPYASAPWFPVLLSGLFAIMVNFLAFFALFGAKDTIDGKTIRTGFRFNYSEKDKSAMSEHIILDMSGNLNARDMSNVLARIGTQGDIATLKEASTQAGTPSLASAIFTAVSKSWEDQSLVSRFQHIMIDEQFFLQPGLTIGDIAERLHTNKNYISRMVNQTYNMGFPEVLNILRIDYAEQFIPTHPEMTQEDIAKACGFVSATYFNSTFKRITGYTPKVWATRNML